MSKEKTSPKRKRTLGQWLDSPNVSGYVFVGPFIIGFGIHDGSHAFIFCIFIYKIQYFTVPDIHWAGKLHYHVHG